MYFLENLLIHSITMSQACLWEHDLPDDISFNKYAGGLGDYVNDRMFESGE